MIWVTGLKKTLKADEQNRQNITLARERRQMKQPLMDSSKNEVFREYVKQILVPTLRPGDIVGADNLSAHKDSKAKEAIEAAGAQRVFLPPYWPDLNLIEKMWSKVKEKLRSIGARTYDSLLKAMAIALNSVTKWEANGWFASCGYRINKL